MSQSCARGKRDSHRLRVYNTASCVRSVARDGPKEKQRAACNFIADETSSTAVVSKTIHRQMSVSAGTIDAAGRRRHGRGGARHICSVLRRTRPRAFGIRVRASFVNDAIVFRVSSIRRFSSTGDDRFPFSERRKTNVLSIYQQTA